MRITASLVCCGLLALVFAGSASAKVVNLFVYNGVYPSGSFDGSDAIGAGPMGNPRNIDINQATGDVYASAGSTIYHFNSAGVSQPFTALAPDTVISGQSSEGLGALKVDNSGGATNGNIYVKSEYTDLYGFASSGAGLANFPIKNLGDGCGAAVAPDGGIWISNYGEGLIKRYDPTTGAYSGTSLATPSPCGFAIDAAGNFYVPGYGGGTIKKYSSTGTLLNPAWASVEGTAENIAIDRSTGNVFTAQGTFVSEFDSSGALIGTFGGAEGTKSYPGLQEAEGIAVNETTHRVYVGNGNGHVDTFVQTGPQTIPDVATGSATAGPSTAVLHGTVDPDAGNGGTAITHCNFEWGLTTSYGHVTPCEEALPINSPSAVQTTITGLEKGSVYHYRITAASANDIQASGTDAKLETPGAHVFERSFGTATSDVVDPYPLSAPSFLAADNSGGPGAGDIYVADPPNHWIEKFDADGNLLAVLGKDVNKTAVEAAGPTASRNLCVIGSGDVCQIGISSTELGGFEEPYFVAVDPTTGDLYVGDKGAGQITKFDPAAQPITTFAGDGAISELKSLNGITVDQHGNLFASNGWETVNWYEPSGKLHTSFKPPSETSGPFGMSVDAQDHLYVGGGYPEIYKFTNTGTQLESPNRSGATTGFAVDPNSNDLFSVEDGFFAGTQVNRFGLNCGESCKPTESFGKGILKTPKGITIAAGSENVYVANTGEGDIVEFTATYPKVKTGPPVTFGQSDAVISGTIDPFGRGGIVECRVEYGLDVNYESGQVPCEPATPYSGTEVTAITAHLTELVSGEKYHYRVVASNGIGEGVGGDRIVSGTQAPSINAVNASNVTATAVDLNAVINPEGSDTTYKFEYGPTTSYGQTATLEADLGGGQEDVSRTVHVEGLESGVRYHFRVIATNALGTTTSEDQTFAFFSPDCPNRHVRQETSSNRLPDCRAYELVSPANGGGAQLFNLSTNSFTADNAYAFGGALGLIPGTGDPVNSLFAVDTYVAKRTNVGWTTRYVGIQSDETWEHETAMANQSNEKFIAYNYDPLSSFKTGALELYDFDGNRIEAWPPNIQSIPGAKEARGAKQPSPDFSKYFFSSEKVAFTQDGQTLPPGSAYEYDTKTKEISLISLNAENQPIQAEPGNPSEERYFIRFPRASGEVNGFGSPTQAYPSVSTDGSHVVMSTFATPYDQFNNPHPLEHLYMRVDNEVTYDLAEGPFAHYVGMTPNGKTVYFTSPRKLLPEDEDTSEDMYRWTEEGQLAGEPLTLISKGNNGNGNSDACSASWTSKCGIVPIHGWAPADNAISANNASIYFYSPEKLDGTKGIVGRQNVYDFREGQIKFVASFVPDLDCNPAPFAGQCANGPVGRIQVNPTDTHAAFVTSSHLTAYENNGFFETYTYNPVTGKIICASCRPDGKPPTTTMGSAESGLFMANDGRTFFYTSEALVPQDTNDRHDVYEFVEGRPQLITRGTGSAPDEISIEDPSSIGTRASGFLGVTASGINVFFTTYDTFVPQDRNGNFIKIYDARTNGGFAYTPPEEPCAAADECHGAGSEAPAPPQVESGSDLGKGGNLKPTQNKKQSKKKSSKKKHKKAKKKKHSKRAGGQNRG